MLKTKKGNSFDVSGVLEDYFLGALHIRILNSSIEEVDRVFSNSEETEILTYNDTREDTVYSGYTKLLSVVATANDIEVMLSK